MTIEINQLGNIESFHNGFEEDQSDLFERNETIEEPICSKCLEIESECYCHLYDKLEAVELAKERAEDAMGRLKPVSMEIIKPN
jgi:hypothetical protein